VGEDPVLIVLMELEHLVGINKCLILSVVGTQSSGKSTLLNAMFGLQFPVGHGTCKFSVMYVVMFSQLWSTKAFSVDN
jgi:ABC-type branched-subunit amino acid transport system ATPase component